MSHGRAEVKFINSTQRKISVAYMRRDFVCLADCGDRWDVLGWINLDPGETEIRTNPTENQMFYAYAERDDGVVYNGPFPAEVTDSRFQKCTCLGTTSPLW